MGDATQNSTQTSKSTKIISRIPMFQRTPSLRLKGEKVVGKNEAVGGIHFSRRAALTRSASLNEKLNSQLDKDLFKYNIGDCSSSSHLKGNSEYESLTSTPMLSPEIDDSCSVSSFRSCASSTAMSFDCAAGNHFKFNKKKKYVLHCPNHCEPEEYLTPTQRKDRQIRQLKAQLMRAKREVDEKEAEIMMLTKEMVNLKSNNNGISSTTASSAATNIVSEANDKCLTKEIQLNDVFHSNADSGLCEQFDEAKENGWIDRVDGASGGKLIGSLVPVEKGKNSLFSFNEFYHKEIEDLKRNHSNEYQEMKEKYNDKIETLLQKLSDANIKYFDLRPKFDRAQEIVKQQEAQISRLEKENEEQDKRHHQMYLKMYKKGQEAAKFEHADEVLEFAHQAPKRVAVPELLQQLKSTERELERVKALYRRELYKRSDGIESEMTLRFLKDVIYHFLTNKDSRDHLRAIENIMGYTDSERMNIERSVFTRNKLVG
ncbi:hypothetical protein CHUAL_001204 [Chamberlinius hualienensis]